MFTFKGTVEDHAGAPITGADLIIQPDPRVTTDPGVYRTGGTTVTTDELGRFEVDLATAPGLTYTVRSTGGGHVKARRFAAPEDGATVDLADITPVLAPSPMDPYVRGASAYEVWLAAGNAGTVDDYLQAQHGHVDQVDMVDLVRAQSPSYSSLCLARTGAGTYQVRLHDGTHGIVYQVVKDAADDFHKLDASYTGPVAESLVDSVTPEGPDGLTGAWTIAGSSRYTSELGGTFVAAVSGGSRMQVRVTREPRGGLWSITVDGGPPVLVTCYAPSGFANVWVTVGEGLDPSVPHTVVGTFMGPDPDNPPSSGPGRGYLATANGLHSVQGLDVDATATNIVLAPSSNKEFAFQVSDGTNHNWVPEHNNMGSAFATDPVQFRVDGAPVSLDVGQSVAAAESVELVQRFRGRIVVTGQEVAQFRTSHRVGLDGVVHFDGRMRALAAHTVRSGYPMMLPGHGPSGTDEHVTGILTRHVSTGDESTNYLPDERDDVHSAAVVGSAVPDVIGAATLAHPRLSYRRGQTHRPAPTERMFVWARANYPKLYWSAFAHTPLEEGDVYAWGARFVVAEFPGARRMVTP